MLTVLCSASAMVSGGFSGGSGDEMLVHCEFVAPLNFKQVSVVFIALIESPTATSEASARRMLPELVQKYFQRFEAASI